MNVNSLQHENSQSFTLSQVKHNSPHVPLPSNQTDPLRHIWMFSQVVIFSNVRQHVELSITDRI